MQILASSDSRPEGPPPTSVALNRSGVEYDAVAVGLRWPQSQVAQSLNRARTSLLVRHAPADRCNRLIVRCRCYQGAPPDSASVPDCRQASQADTEVAVDRRGGACTSLARHRPARYCVPRQANAQLSFRTSAIRTIGRAGTSQTRGCVQLPHTTKVCYFAARGNDAWLPRRVRTRECCVFRKPWI